MLFDLTIDRKCVLCPQPDIHADGGLCAGHGAQNVRVALPLRAGVPGHWRGARPDPQLLPAALPLVQGALPNPHSRMCASGEAAAGIAHWRCFLEGSFNDEHLTSRLKSAGWRLQWCRGRLPRKECSFSCQQQEPFRLPKPSIGVTQGHFQIIFNGDHCPLLQPRLSIGMKLMYCSGVWSYVVRQSNIRLCAACFGASILRVRTASAFAFRRVLSWQTLACITFDVCS